MRLPTGNGSARRAILASTERPSWPRGSSASFARAGPARSGAERAPEVTFHHCFLRHYRNDLPVLAGCGRASRSIIAHAVPHKGADVSWRAEQVCRDVKRLGHNGRVSLRCDHEPAVVRFLREVATRRGAPDTILEHLPVEESQANGRAERADHHYQSTRGRQGWPHNHQ